MDIVIIKIVIVVLKRLMIFNMTLDTSKQAKISFDNFVIIASLFGFVFDVVVFCLSFTTLNNNYINLIIILVGVKSVKIFINTNISLSNSGWSKRAICSFSGPKRS